jgi:hypothetical protein
VVSSGDHAERIYGCQVSLAGPIDRRRRKKTHPYETCDIIRLVRESSMIGKRYEPSMSDETFANHTPMVIKIMIFSVFQIAILPSFFKCLVLGG